MDDMDFFSNMAPGVEDEIADHPNDSLIDLDPLDTSAFYLDLDSGLTEDHTLEIADPVTDLVYLEPDGFDQLARDLWEEIGPGGSLPVGPDGGSLTAPEIFAELQAHTDDPTTLSMLTNGIEQWRRAQGSWER